MSFRPTASVKNLELRSKKLAQLRSHFAEAGFVEVETPLLSHDTVVDRHLHPVLVSIDGEDLWLQTSPEFAMKRLVASGMDAIYQITRAVRSGENGKLHNTEFTILEWYKVGQSYEAAREFLSSLAEAILGISPPEQITYQDLFKQFMDLDPINDSESLFTRRASELGLHVPNTWETLDRDSKLDFLLADAIQPQLQSRAMVVYDYPASQAALAASNGETAERFELFINGLELANGYHELLDAKELRDRNRDTNEQRLVDGNDALPEESRLLDAMDSGLPDCSGVALGIDRLMMIAAGTESIRDVIAFPMDRA